MVIVTRHDDHRIRGHLMGLTNLATDKVKSNDETNFQKKSLTSAYTTDEDSWTTQYHQ